MVYVALSYIIFYTSDEEALTSYHIEINNKLLRNYYILILRRNYFISFVPKLLRPIAIISLSINTSLSIVHFRRLECHTKTSVVDT